MLPVMIHIEYAAATRRAVVSAFWFVDMTDQAVFSGGIVKSESPLYGYSSWVSADSLDDWPKEENKNEIVEDEKNCSADITPRVDVENEKFDNTKVDEDNDGDYDDEEGIWAFLS